LGESYSGIRTLADFIRDVTKYQQAFWHRYRGMAATLSSDSVILISFSFSFLLPLPLQPMEQPYFSRLSNPRASSGTHHSHQIHFFWQAVNPALPSKPWFEIDPSLERLVKIRAII